MDFFLPPPVTKFYLGPSLRTLRKIKPPSLGENCCDLMDTPMTLFCCIIFGYLGEEFYVV